MEDIPTTISKSVVSIVVLFILARLMGKKQLSQLSFFDYVSGISIGSTAASFGIEPNVDYKVGILNMIIFALFPIILSYISMKSYRGRKLLDGTPSILIQNGKIIESNMAKTKMNINDLLEECRLKDVFDISQISYAVMETSGKVSIQLKAENRPVTAGEMGMQAGRNGLCVNLIIDGEVLAEHLDYVRHDRSWLGNELAKQHYGGPEQVLLAYLDTSGKLVCFPKHFDPPKCPTI